MKDRNQQAEYFAALSKKRTVSADVLLEDIALSGVWERIVNKYSDQAHFIYELLQNADDAKATSTRFELFPDRLVFAHNGTRHFSVSDPTTEKHDRQTGKLGDINAITTIGASSKIRSCIHKGGNSGKIKIWKKKYESRTRAT